MRLSGDGRCDSHGHNAKYGTYTMIDRQSDQIVEFQIVQCTEVNNSNEMEREGFKCGMDNIKAKGGNIKVITTDRHVGIRADLKRNYSEVDHQFDVWHLSKSITKKLMEKAKKKTVVICLLGLSQYQIIFAIGGVQKHVMETMTFCGRSGHP